MPLAAIDFSYPMMLVVGLLAAGVPVVLHLLNRIRSPIVPFPTLRFLRITAQKTSRKRQLQQWLLLLLRMALFAMLGIAVASPIIGGGNIALAYGMVLLLLAGVGLLALAVVMLVAVWDKRRAASSEEMVAQTRARSAEDKARAVAQRNPLLARMFVIAVAVVAFVCSWFGGYALATGQYFSKSAKGFTGHSTACVIILDNSHSMLARQDSATRLQRAEAYIRQMLLEVVRPAECALILTNPAGDDAAALTSEPSTILAKFEKLETLGRAYAMRDRVEKGLGLLKESQQPTKLLVVISDFQQEAFADVEAFSKTAEVPNLQVVLMPMATAKTRDLGVTKFELESGQPAVGTEVTFGAEIMNNGDGPETAELEFLVDGQAVITAKETVEAGRDGKLTRKIPYRLAAAGWHRFGMRVKDENGAMAWDDVREVALNVKDQIHVLVVGAGDRPKFRSAAYYAMAALAPFEGVKTAGTMPAWSLAPVYRAAGAVDTRTLGQYAAVILCDVPQVPGMLARSLKSYVNGGGRLVVQTGPGVDGANYNEVLGDQAGLLPARLGRVEISAEGSQVEYVDVSAGTAVFAELYDTLEPFERVVVTGRWGLEGENVGGVLWKLADGSPLIVRHAVGTGDVYMMLTVPSAEWSNFSTQPAYLALMNRMAQGELGNTRRSKTIETGEAVRVGVPSENGRLRVFLTSPDRKTVEVTASGEVPPVWMSPVILREGEWTWETSDGPPASFRGFFVVNPPAEEADLTLADPEVLAAGIVGALPTRVARTPGEMVLQLQGEERSLMPGVLAMVTILLVLEALFANRYRPSVRGVAGVREMEGVGRAA